jgi:DNA-binding response OmpR family regulator
MIVPSVGDKLTGNAGCRAREAPVQTATLQGERVLVVEDEPLIAMDLRATFEREGARVVLARTMRQALRYADAAALSAGVLDFRVGSDDADPVCDALTRREVPFIFFTGLSGALPQRWGATPIVPKPAAPKAVIGALKFVLSPEAREIVVRSQRGDFDGKLARIEEAISEGEERIMRVRRCIARLASMGADTSAGERVVATMTAVLENMRAHRELSATFASKLVR